MRRSKRVMAQMNVVPYIDVMLVLLVIFMVTAPMLTAGVEVNPPQAEAEPLTSNNQQEPLIILVDIEGKYFIEDDQPMTLSEVSDYTRIKLAAASDRSVYVKADGRVEYQYLMQAMVALQQSGSKKIGLMADPIPKR